jgi:DNA replication initiation complex subunit (GINS family)
MDFKKEYEQLYQHWLNEFQQIDLTQLTEDLFNKYQHLINKINNFRLNNKEKIKDRIISSYKDNFNFLFNDFLKIREIKILNSALALQEIDLNDLIEVERLFYQSLVSAIKGFKKVKAISIFEDSFDKEIKQIQKTQVKELENAEEINQEIVNLISDTNFKGKDDQYNYTLIRFLKKTPALVGIDLINYGPFEKEDITFLPYKNAKIILSEKFAEKIELS